MLRIVQLEDLQRLLLLVPRLVDQLERGEAGFAEEAKNWLTSVEEALKANRMPTAGRVSALRGIIISAQRGLTPEGINLRARPTRRRICDAAAADAIRRAGDLVHAAIQQDFERVREAEVLGRQLVALSKARGLLIAKSAQENQTRYLQALWRSFAGDSELAPGVVRMESLVGPHDALVVLDRAMAADSSE